MACFRQKPAFFRSLLGVLGVLKCLAETHRPRALAHSKSHIKEPAITFYVLSLEDADPHNSQRLRGSAVNPSSHDLREFGGELPVGRFSITLNSTIYFQLSQQYTKTPPKLQPSLVLSLSRKDSLMPIS